MHELIEKDLKYVWHPYTQMKDLEKVPPLLIKRARGIKLYDENGKFYYDTISSWWCNVHGHNHPRIKAAIRKQLGLLEHTLFAGITHEPAVRLAEKLVSITPPNLTRVFFSDNGSTAVEVALKMSFQYRKNTGTPEKEKFVCLENGYHGDTIGAMSVSGVGQFNELFSSLFFPAHRIPSPYCYRCPAGKGETGRGNEAGAGCGLECLKPLERLLKRKASDITAVILEPLLQAAGGMVVYPVKYLKKVSRLTREFDVHLILDEVATGFGRTGKMFACEHADVRPDFLCLSKGITSGYLPLGATLTTDRIYRAFYGDYEKNKTFYHGHTQTANPLSCSAALASLEIFSAENTLEHVEKMIPLFRAGLDEFRELPFVGDVRHLGMAGALELVSNKKTKTPFTLKERIGYRVYREGLKENLLLRPLGNVTYFFLPLCVRRRELTDILKKTWKILEDSRLTAQRI